MGHPSGLGWTMWVGTVRGTNMHLYSNGEEVACASSAYEPAKVLRTQHYLGRSLGSYPTGQGGIVFFDGVIRSLHVWGRELDATEVDALYELFTKPTGCATPFPSSDDSRDRATIAVVVVAAVVVILICVCAIALVSKAPLTTPS